MTLATESFYYDSGVYYAPSIDPNDELDYTLDFSGIIGSDEIASVEWTASTGLTIVTGKLTNTTKAATVWLKSGVIGSVVTVTCKITTIGARTVERSFRIKVENK